MSMQGRVCGVVAVMLLAAANSAQAQRRTVSTRPVPPPSGTANTPNPPPPPPPPPSSIRPPPAPPPAAAPAPAPPAPGSPAPAPQPGRDTVIVPVVVGITPTVYNGNYVATGGGYVLQGPPAPVLESRSMQPYPAMAWVPGRYEWNGSQYFWRQGEWVYIPAGYTQYVPGKWDYNTNGWFWINGYWR